MKEEGVEEQGGEKAAAAATTAVELPNSTASTMETSGGGEGPNSGAPPPCSVSTQRPLERLMRDITLEAKDGDIIFSHHSCRQAPLPTTMNSQLRTVREWRKR